MVHGPAGGSVEIPAGSMVEGETCPCGEARGAAAERCGCAERTVRRWLACPAFAEAYRERCRAALDAATARLAGATADAVETLRRNLACGVPANEIRAAGAILAHAVALSERFDLTTRLDELERRFAEPSHPCEN
jgi:hypothetical protein